jgi:hypothetical protein
MSTREKLIKARLAGGPPLRSLQGWGFLCPAPGHVGDITGLPYRSNDQSVQLFS